MTDLPAGVSPGQVLLAEDSAVVRAMVRQVLESAGYTVSEAVNGQLAFELCLRAKPDIALLSVEMPVLDGRELLKRMKADPRCAEIPVIFLTGHTSTAEVVEGLRLGAHDYLPKPFEPSELIARVSAAIRVARLQQQLNRQNAELDFLSRIDQLTGLYNRRHGEERLREEIENASRHGRPLTLLMIDVDHFKAVNDRYGHAGGDAVLRELARRLQGVLRSGDVAARWGGEEFLVILPTTGLDGGAKLGERLLNMMRGSPFAVDDRETCVLTVSIGVSGSDEKSPVGLLREADDALYRAKSEGRDRLCLAPK